MKKIVLTGKYGYIIGNYALVDDEDFDEINKWQWCCLKKENTFYATRSRYKELGINIQIKMHRKILGLTDPIIMGEHVDLNGLNCQRSNLRIATNSQNQANKMPVSGNKYKGAILTKHGTWHSYIKVNGKRFHLGTYKYEHEAAEAYNEGAIKYFGEFARLNEIKTHGS